MPGITLQTLGGIPGIQQPGDLQQNGTNNCGAYAIIAAVGAFGAFPQNAGLAYAAVTQGPPPVAVMRNSNVAVGNTFPQLCAGAYSITGILNPPPQNLVFGPVNPELLVAGNGYNSPAAMAGVAVDLGRPVPSINVQPLGFAVLAALYPGEQRRCELVVGVGNVNVNAGPYAPPGANETNVVCVNAGAGLHWLAQGSDGNFYDPADGSLNNAWNPQNTGDQMGPYTFAGLWMVIR
jgi:hypothetical protein